MGTRTRTACLVFLLAAPCLAQDRTMKLQRLEYLVGELPEHPQQLTITRDAMRYESHSNASRPGSLGIGVYERPLATGEIDTIEANLNPAALGPLPDHYGKVLSGDRSKRIRATGEGGAVEKLVGTTLPIDGRLQRAIDRLDMLVNEVTRYPAQVLQVSLEDATVRRGELSATMIFSSAGDRPVKFQPPRGESDPPDLITVFWWQQTPSGQKGTVHAAPASVQIAGANTTGALATFHLRSRFERAPAGPISVQVRYYNAKPGAGDIVGELFSNPIVVPSRSPEP